MCAFVERKARKIKNDRSDGTILAYHGNTIAEWLPNGDLEWTMAGWSSATTRLRLNQLFQELGLPFVIYQKQHTQRLWHRGTDEKRAISSRETYTVEAFDIAAMRHLKG
jgi:hypothetical protein